MAISAAASAATAAAGSLGSLAVSHKQTGGRIGGVGCAAGMGADNGDDDDCISSRIEEVAAGGGVAVKEATGRE